MPNEPTLNWTEARRSRRFVWLAIGTLLSVLAVLVALGRFLRFNEGRRGVRLIDPVLAMLPVAEFSVPLFLLIYGTVAVALVSLVRHPRALLVALQAYVLLITFRMGMMYVIPLEAPAGMIVLADPAARAFGNGSNLAKDLFFSGHTSTTFLCALSARSRTASALCFVACASVAALILIQHAHYTIDVLVAPFVAFASHRLAYRFSARVLSPPPGTPAAGSDRTTED